MKQNVSQKAFSLVELSVVLTIIGITLAGAIDLAIRKTESDHIEETEARIATITQALESFLVNNQRLPCPADATLATSSTDFGRAGTATESSGSGVCTITTQANYFTTGNIYSGGVPTLTIGIDDKNMYDSWGKRFTYVLDARFANNYTTNASCNNNICFKQTAAGGIRVNDSGGAARTTEAVYVLISHGDNGYGAWKYIGSTTRIPASTDTNETDNAGNDKGASFDNVFVQADTSATFDDIVVYQTKELIIDSVEGITDGTTCLAAFDAATSNTSPTSTDPCPNDDATAQANCYAMANLVNNLCLQP